MMIDIGRLYQLSEKDRHDLPITPLFKEVVDFGTKTDCKASYKVPLGQILVLSSAFVLAQAGASQTVNYIDVYFADEAGTEMARLTRSFPGIQNATLSWAGTDSIIIPPGYSVFVEALFSAGTNSNNVKGSVIGVLLPRGNVGAAVY